MTRTTMCRASVLALALLWTALATDRLVARQPNIILVITDDQGYGDVGAHGNTAIRTPHLDQLHSESVRLTDFHVDPTCSPSRSALMSGRYSTRTGVWHTIMGRSLMRTEELTLAEVLRKGGYRTGMFGKWHLGDNAPCRPQDQGFEEVFWHKGGGVGQGPDYWGNDYFDDTYFRGSVPEKVEGYCTDVWFREATRFVEKHRDVPFFAYISTNAPHGPYLVDEKYSKPYVEQGVPGTMAKFYGMIENIDENLGHLRKRLEELSIAENTLLVFLTDNGSAAGWRARKNQRARWRGFNAGMRDGKGSEYDGGHRVPCFWHWPAGKLVGGRDVDQLTAHIDLLPTLAELCGVDKPEGPAIDGTSLASILRGDRDALRDRTLFVHSQRVPDPIKWRKCAVMTERWRLVNGKELYDIEKDPGQKKNLAEEHAEVTEKLVAAYEAWWKSLEPSFELDVRIALGSEAEPVSHLHSHDWQLEPGVSSPWHQNHVKKGLVANGTWAVDVAAAGKYWLTLRRWPSQRPGPLEAKEARLAITRPGAEKPQSAVQQLADDAEEVRFEIELEKGPQSIQGTLLRPDGVSRGAYFLEVRRATGS